MCVRLNNGLSDISAPSPLGPCEHYFTRKRDCAVWLSEQAWGEDILLDYAGGPSVITAVLRMDAGAGGSESGDGIVM